MGMTYYTTLQQYWGLPSGELTFCHGRSPFLMGKSTISMAIFNSYVKLPEGIGDEFIIQELGIPVLNQPGFNGMIEGWLEHCSSGA